MSDQYPGDGPHGRQGWYGQDQGTPAEQQPTQQLPQQLPQQPQQQSAQQQQQAAAPYANPHGTPYANPYAAPPQTGPQPGAQFGGPQQPSPFGGPFSTDPPAVERPRRRTRWGLIGGLGAAAVVGLVTVLVISQTGASAGTGSAAGGQQSASAASASASPTPSGFQPSSNAPAAASEQLAQVFLAAWQSGNLKQAAAYTDDPTAAQAALTSYQSGLNISGLKLAAQGAGSASGVVGFAVSATVASAANTSKNTATAASGTWSYASKLTAYQKDGGWWVKWDPTILASNATASTHLVALAVKPGVAKVTDASGNNLSSSSQSGLQDIAEVMTENTKSTQGTAGLEIVQEDSSGKVVSGSKHVLTEPVSTAVVKTTIDPSMEAVATAAVAQLPRSGLVVIRPSTGAILAVANSKGSGDIALTGTLAPGSSMKVVTTTGLLVDGLLPQGINTHVGCPLIEDVQGVKIHNSTSSATDLSGTEDYEPDSTPFSTDFAQSCNNAFTQWWQQMAGGKLANAASTYYGLNQPWDIGLGESGTYFSMPSHQSGSELAEELYGQGEIEANPLSMASIAATVDTGSFHQPYLVDGLTDKVSATPLPSSVKSQLYTVMREVITSGTADAVGFGSGVYGKTGTAEADANKDNYPNGWMIVFDPSKDLAIGCVVVDSNFGAKTAGPEVKYVLEHS